MLCSPGVFRGGGRLHGPDDAQVEPREVAVGRRAIAFCRASDYWFATVPITRTNSTGSHSRLAASTLRSLCWRRSDARRPPGRDLSFQPRVLRPVCLGPRPASGSAAASVVRGSSGGSNVAFRGITPDRPSSDRQSKLGRTGTARSNIISPLGARRPEVVPEGTRPVSRRRDGRDANDRAVLAPTMASRTLPHRRRPSAKRWARQTRTRHFQAIRDGRYWARTSDLLLVRAELLVPPRPRFPGLSSRRRLRRSGRRTSRSKRMRLDVLGCGHQDQAGAQWNLKTTGQPQSITLL